MATTIDFQGGPARVRGIKGTATWTVNGGTAKTVAANINIESLGFKHDFKLEEFPSTDGNTIESIAAYQQKRTITVNLVPIGSTRANADTVLSDLMGMSPLDVIELASFTNTQFNKKYNYTGGGEVRLTREGYAVFGVTLTCFEWVTSGQFGHLTLASG